MISLLRILAGFSCFFVFVIQPTQASLFTGIAIHYPMAPQDQIILLTKASQLDPCDVNVLNLLGDSYVNLRDNTMAAIQYGNAMICSPGFSLNHFKMGEILFAMGYDGNESLKNALRLEPNNPAYKSEYLRIKALQSQSQ